MAKSDVEFLLEQWGAWSRGGLGGLSGPYVGGGRAPNISDEMALRIDCAVIACGVQRPVLRHVIELYYQKGRNVTEIQLFLRVGRVSVEKYLIEARAFVAGRLSVFRDAA